MNCSEFRELLPAYLLGELEGPQLERFLRHAESCEPCRQELEFELRLEQELRKHPAPGLEAQVLARLGSLDQGLQLWAELAPAAVALGWALVAVFVFLKIWPSLALWSLVAFR